MPSDNTRPRLKKLDVTPPAKSNLGNSAPPTPFILTDIRKIIREEINEAITTILGKRLDMLENKLREFSQVTKTIVEIEHAMEFAANQVQDLQQVALPTMDKKIKDIATALVKRSLDLDVHRRKWSLTIQCAGRCGGTIVRHASTMHRPCTSSPWCRRCRSPRHIRMPPSSIDG